MFSNHKKAKKGLYEDIYISLILNIMKNYNNLKYFSCISVDKKHNFYSIDYDRIFRLLLGKLRMVSVLKKKKNLVISMEIYQVYHYQSSNWLI